MKNQVKKWLKRVTIVIGVCLTIFLLYVAALWSYWNWYVPYHCKSLYNEGINNPSKAESIAKQLYDSNDPYGESNSRAIDLITFYVKKKEQWAQIMLEQYNEKHGITIESITSINRNIGGVCLGNSTKQDVLKYLNTENLSYQDLGNGDIIKVYSDYKFAGVYWDYVYYCFTNDKVYKVLFTLKSSAHSETFYKLKDMLANKYTQSKNLSSKQQDVFSLTDSSTTVILDNSHFKELRCEYKDTHLEKSKELQDLESL